MKYRLVLSPEIRQTVGRVAVIAAWVLGGGGLLLFVFVFSFYMAMKVERSSTEVVVPDLRGLPLEEAGRVVEPLALVLEVVDERHDPAMASGRILQQQPPDGSRVRRGRKLKLVLSRGGRVLTVPDLIGKADRAVEIELRRDGFGAGERARVSSSETPAGRILAQVPPAGSPGVPNTRVHRLVSQGPRTYAWVMPDLTGLDRSRAEKWIDLCGFRRSQVRRIKVRGKAPDTVVGQMPLAGYPIHRNDIVELTVAR